ncbi:lysM domain receptor-like kinase 3 [Humulus lupulus]|uniref:lysM domain receptor-like kinase 3 n=1 Tax=Humulus lupulus TaxID=3486 RepID=UPI002B407AE0|nr:lysM domain receptor-like kinase 3 [Humulus lupulus]
MASYCNLLPYLSLVFPIVYGVSPQPSNVTTSTMHTFNCSAQIKTCNALLYYDNEGVTKEEVASYYHVNASSQIKSIIHGNKEDYLISVPCSCSSLYGTNGYFYNTTYKVKFGDTFQNVSTKYYSGQAWYFEDEDPIFKPNKDFPIHLLCGCSESDSQIVVTYTVQAHDTVSSIATLLSAKFDNLVGLNGNLALNPEYIEVGWVLFVPMEKNGINNNNTSKIGMRQKWKIITGILASVTVLSMGALIVILVRRKRLQQKNAEDPKGLAKILNAKKSFSLQNTFTPKENFEDFDSEKPVVFSLEEIEEATGNFDESRKVGEGGYGSVYFGILGKKEVAIKKMRSNKSKEFFAELKVLCRIHHINVVELLGYACGDDHLYLAYEYVRNGSLSEHLHDPLLKGHQPLSWSARAQIALGAAKGIEYIHDHTKERYVHRDIKTTNILLDEGLRAKIADFGLAKLVGGANEDDLIATRLVGTPGYLPPESVKEFQITPKTDVFAFGVVLAELITGQRALIRDNREPNKMKSLITVVKTIFQDEDPESALQAEIDGNLRGSYPIDEIFKMAEVAESCLEEEAVDRPEMRDIVVKLSQIMMSSTEWEASLGGNSQVFSGVFTGR